jgi:hypothetical protein
MKKKKKVMAVGEGRTRVDMILEAIATEEGEQSPDVNKGPRGNEGLDG